MNTWNDVISLADTNFRNTFQSSVKVKWLSLALAQVLQLKFNRDVTFAFIDVYKDIQDLPIPDNCETDDIISLQVEVNADTGVFRDYLYRDITDPVEGPYYTIINKMIHIQTRPSEDKLAVLFYIGTPELTTDDLDSTVPLPLAYRELMVHALCERMAAARNDVVRKNNFKSDYDSLLGDFLMNQFNNSPEYPVAKDVLPRRSSYGGKMATWPYGSPDE